MSDQAANEAQASIGSQDDASTSSSHSKEEAPSNFQKQHLAASWLTAFDRKLYFKDNIEGMQATGAESNSPAFTAAITDRKTADIDEHRAYTSLHDDWLQDNDPDGTFAAKRDTAAVILDPLFAKRSHLVKEVVRTHNALRTASTNSSGAADPAYDAFTAAYQHAQEDMMANDALIRGTLEPQRAGPENAGGIPPTATNQTTNAATTPGPLANPSATAGHSEASSPLGFPLPPTPTPPAITFSVASRLPALICTSQRTTL
jgi:hypothetical protein